MGQAKQRGTFEQRKEQAIAAGRVKTAGPQRNTAYNPASFSRALLAAMFPALAKVLLSWKA